MSCCNEAVRLEARVEGVAISTPRIRFEVVALIIAGFIAGNTSIATLTINLSEIDTVFRFWLQFALAVSCAMVFALLMPQILRNAASNLRGKRISVDLLFSMGALGSLTFSLVNFLRGEGPVYFEVFNVLLVIYCLGAFVKRRAQSSVLSSLEGWSSPEQLCHVIDADGRLHRREVGCVEAGDRVVVPSGGAIPVDGFVRSGKAFVKESLITGEPHLRSVHAGDRVYASSVSTDAGLEVEASTSGRERQVDEIRSAIHETIMSTSRWQSSADRVSRWFTPGVAIIAVLTFCAWSVIDGPATGIMTALTVLLVACPCAFGFATPVAVWVCASRLASIGWQPKSGDAMEKLSQVDTVVFDKTGTLTVPEPRLVELLVRPGGSYDEPHLLNIASSLQSQSQHPVATAFAGRGHVQLAVRDAEPIPGVGIRGRIQHGPRELQVEIGRLEDLHRPCCDAALLAKLDQRLHHGQYAIAFRIDDELAAVAIVEEKAVDSLEAGIRELSKMGLSLHVYSGDRDERVAQLGIDSYAGNLSPEAKAARVRSLNEAGHQVLFIGDGINDTVAMTESSVSVAVAHGAPLASSVADIRWEGEDLRSIAEALKIAHRSTSRLRWTLLFAVSYNTLGMTIAAFGWLHPVVAVLLMMASSLTVVFGAADLNPDTEMSPRLGSQPVRDHAARSFLTMS